MLHMLSLIIFKVSIHQVQMYSDMYFLALDNLPSELQHIYEELGTKERLFLKYKREKDARETQIFRHIRQHGGHTANPFEDKYNKQIEEIFDKMEQIQEEKCILADKAKELVLTTPLNFASFIC